MDFDDAKELMKEQYIDAGCELVDEKPRQLFFSYGKTSFFVSEEDIAEYCHTVDDRANLRTTPVECSICGDGYREQSIEFLNPGQSRAISARFDLEYSFKNVADDGVRVEIGHASNRFINYFRFEEAYVQLFLHKILRPPNSAIIRESHRNNGVDARSLYYWPITVRVYGLPNEDVGSTVKKSNAIIESCLFQLCYLKNVPAKLTEKWPMIKSRRVKKAEFEFGDHFAGRELPLPKANYNSDIVRFYQLGMSNNEPVLQFLAFYQVLEYFFVKVSDEKLYSKLASRVNDGKFKTVPKHLDRIIQDVLDHKRVTDELEMLKNVLHEYVDEEDVAAFIRAYEEYLGEKLYTRKRTVFGTDIQVSLSPGHVVGNLAKTIKVFRNALVHSSDRYERASRHIPFSESTELVRKEIPLMKYLAERVIIATAT